MSVEVIAGSGAVSADFSALSSIADGRGSSLIAPWNPRPASNADFDLSPAGGLVVFFGVATVVG